MTNPTDNVRRDRAVGTLLASAAGDALGAPHEFGPSLDLSLESSMTGGGSFGWRPGEWTDNTQTSLAVLAPLAKGLTGPASSLRSGRDCCPGSRAVQPMWATDASRPGYGHRPLEEPLRGGRGLGGPSSDCRETGA